MPDFRVVNYQLEYNGETITVPMPFDVAEQLRLYIERQYGLMVSTVRAEESDGDFWIVGQFSQNGASQHAV